VILRRSPAPCNVFCQERAAGHRRFGWARLTGEDSPTGAALGRRLAKDLEGVHVDEPFLDAVGWSLLLQFRLPACCKASLTWTGVADGCVDLYSAAAPAAWRPAIELPD
jgi:hypothetical protein